MEINGTTENWVTSSLPAPSGDAESIPNNGDINICEVCRCRIDYYYGWRHTDGEAGHMHRAWPQQTAVHDDNQEELQTVPESSVYAWW
jgi:hypothetical protein